MTATMPSARITYQCRECGQEMLVTADVALRSADGSFTLVLVGSVDDSDVRAHMATHGGAA